MALNPYETRRYVEEYLLLHYGEASDVDPFRFLPRAVWLFHRRVAEECLLPVRFRSPTRALDLGCAVGRFAFELGRKVDRVLGVDASDAFIRAARRMARMQRLNVQMKESGGEFRRVTLSLPTTLRQSDVAFRVGDALNLEDLPERSFHVVAALNLLCRLPRPRDFLRSLPRILVPGGQLVLATPFTWLEDYTPRRRWLRSTEVGELLKPHFQLARRRDLPFVIREHRRKYQVVVPEVSVFVRRSD